ncbi:hypothetical protein BC829DRAFT_388261 [Chytridium lagenaria]|nr:hypothetical protein BC829DRAFT_388261 [Chytridium lagenaria]
MKSLLSALVEQALLEKAAQKRPVVVKSHHSAGRKTQTMANTAIKPGLHSFPQTQLEKPNQTPPDTSSCPAPPVPPNDGSPIPWIRPARRYLKKNIGPSFSIARDNNYKDVHPDHIPLYLNRSCDGQGLYPCSCGRKYGTWESLSEHVSLQGHIKCPRCEIFFQKRYDLKKHLDMHDREGSHFGAFAGQRFQGKTEEGCLEIVYDA